MPPTHTISRYNDKAGIREHYDRVSPYYRELWGEHLHHGYWIRGDETKQQAQVQLIEHLARAAGIRPGAKLLDVGCGFGASSIYLAEKYRVEATGITISPVQVDLASQAGAAAGARASFFLMDAEEMAFPNKNFDVIWSVESISHYPEKGRFFGAAADVLAAGGTMAIIDWFKKGNLDGRTREKFIRPIERGMLVELDTMTDYVSLLESRGLHVTRQEVLNRHCAKTWDLCLEIIRPRALWDLAAEMGPAFLDFLKAFRAMKAGFASGNFVYGLLIARRQNDECRIEE
ncbi:MAG TPA: class I SAM-dependent methyltransferase [Candidatus Dormibacteraeota bacterium]|nr:class I SAM-dependent methyltransferase [Candidatus Dormibacteraeota bacterium]